MKQKSVIYLILLSFAVTTIGSVLKIMHTKGSDVFLAIGVATFIIGIALLLYLLFKKKMV